MSMEPYFPPDPRTRLLDITREVASQKRWFHNWSMLRCAGLGLVTTPGDPADVAKCLFEVADQLKESVRWFSSLRNDVRFCLVAGLLRHGLPTSRFQSIFDKTREHFRAVGLPRGETQEMSHWRTK